MFFNSAIQSYVVIHKSFAFLPYKGHYSDDDVQLSIPNIPIPRWLVRGLYSITIDLALEDRTTRIGCLQFLINLR